MAKYKLKNPHPQHSNGDGILQRMVKLKAGTILVPKPDCKYPYTKRIYIVTEEDEKQNATIGDNWIIKR